MTIRHRNFTGANRGNGVGKENLCSLCSLLLNSVRDADFVFLACRAGVRGRRKSDEGGSPCVDNRLPALHNLGGGGREYKDVYIQGDAEVGLFSNEVVVNCAP